MTMIRMHPATAHKWDNLKRAIERVHAASPAAEIEARMFKGRMTNAEMLDIVCDVALDALDPERKITDAGRLPSRHFLESASGYELTVALLDIEGAIRDVREALAAQGPAAED